jgi:hypothetical protein
MSKFAQGQAVTVRFTVQGDVEEIRGVVVREPDWQFAHYGVRFASPICGTIAVHLVDEADMEANR